MDDRGVPPRLLHDEPLQIGDAIDARTGLTQRVYHLHGDYDDPARVPGAGAALANRQGA